MGATATTGHPESISFALADPASETTPPQTFHHGTLVGFTILATPTDPSTNGGYAQLFDHLNGQRKDGAPFERVVRDSLPAFMEFLQLDYTPDDIQTPNPEAAHKQAQDQPGHQPALGSPTFHIWMHPRQGSLLERLFKPWNLPNGIPITLTVLGDQNNGKASFSSRLLLDHHDIETLPNLSNDAEWIRNFQQHMINALEILHSELLSHIEKETRFSSRITMIHDLRGTGHNGSANNSGHGSALDEAITGYLMERDDQDNYTIQQHLDSLRSKGLKTQALAIEAFLNDADHLNQTTAKILTNQDPTDLGLNPDTPKQLLETGKLTDGYQNGELRFFYHSLLSLGEHGIPRITALFHVSCPEFYFGNNLPFSSVLEMYVPAWEKLKRYSLNCKASLQILMETLASWSGIIMNYSYGNRNT